MNKIKRFARKTLSLVLVIAALMSISVVGISSVAAAETDSKDIGTNENGDVRTIYFAPNGYWTNLFAVYAWKDNKNAGEWKALNKVDGVSGLYQVELASSYTHAVFCSRNIPGFSWDAVNQKTDDLVISDEYNYLSLAGETTAVWGYYSTGDLPGDVYETQKIYFTPNAEWTTIQSILYHSFVIRAWNGTESVYAESQLVEGTLGVYPCVWEAEIPAGYDNVQFCRAEGSVESSFVVWESTLEQVVPADSNLFTQFDTTTSGTWSYYEASSSEPEDPTPDNPDEPTPDTPVNPGVTRKVYFTPNPEWVAYTSDGAGRISAAAWDSDNTKTWVWATSVGDGIYVVEIPVEDTNILFGISFGATADLVWAQTDDQTIPPTGNHFIQDSTDTSTGTWGVYQSGTASVYYSVVFVNWDDTFLSAQTVIEGGFATAPADPVREKDSQYTYTFKGWDKAFDAVTSDMVVKAQYDRTPLPAVAPATTGVLKVEVSGGNGFTISANGSAPRPQGTTYLNSKMTIGTNISVTANAIDGLEFLGWYNPDSNVAYTRDYTYSFTTSGNDYIKAVYALEVDGVQLVVFKNDKAAGGNGHILDMQYYAAGDEISFPDDPSQVGYDFAGWSMTEDEIKTLIASGQSVTVVAQWIRQQIFVNVTVIDGTGGGRVLANNAVTVTANAPAEGMKFAYWEDASGNIKSYNESYKLYPSTDVTVKAVYVTEDTVVDYQILVSVDTIDISTADNVFYYSWYVHEDVTFVKAGILAINKDFYDEARFYVGSGLANMYDRSPSGANLKPVNTYTWKKTNVPEGQTWVAKAYVQYRDASGQLQTVYSDIVEITK